MVIHSPPPQGPKGLSLCSGFFPNCLWHNPNSTRRFDKLRSWLSCQCQALDNSRGAQQSGGLTGEPALGEGHRKTWKGSPWVWRLRAVVELKTDSPGRVGMKCEHGGWWHWESVCSGEPGRVTGTGKSWRPEKKGNRTQGLSNHGARVQTGK